MKMWMTRDTSNSDDYDVEFNIVKPTLQLGQFCPGKIGAMDVDENGEEFFILPLSINTMIFHGITNIPLPRKGSRKLVEVKLSIKEA